jgi:hypothetical protein
MLSFIIRHVGAVTQPQQQPFSLQMSIFNWFLIGHLVADWLLQNDWMARKKQQGTFNVVCLCHCMIYTLTLLVILWFVLPNDLANPPYLFFAAVVLVSHWCIDAFKLAQRWGHLFQQTDTPMVRVAVDQTLHLLVLALLTEFLF